MAPLYTYVHVFVSGLRDLFHQSLCLFLCQNQTVLIVIAYNTVWNQGASGFGIYSFFSGLSNFSGSFVVHKNFVMFFLLLWKFPLECLMGIVLDLELALVHEGNFNNIDSVCL